MATYKGVLEQKTGENTSDILYPKTSTDQVDGLSVELQDIREIAEGKKQTYVVSDITNPVFNSQNETITIDSSIVDIEGTSLTLNSLKVGDTIYVSELDVPDRWVSSFLDRVAIISANGQSSVSNVPAPDHPAIITSSIYYDSNYNPVELRSAGNAKDTYNNGVLTRNIGVIDLGTVTSWSQNETKKYWTTSSVSYKRPAGVSDASNFLCNKYENKGWQQVIAQTIGISGNFAGQIILYNPDFNNLSGNELISALSGTTLYYELSTPTVENIVLYQVGERTGAILSKLETAKVPVTDVQVNGNSVVSNSIANVDLSDYTPTSRLINSHALTSDITLDKSDIGLGNVDNTSDANKPISTATQAALDLKQNTITSTNKLSASLVDGLSTVATSGSYNDLSNKPTIDSAVSLTSTNALQNKKIPEYVAARGENLVTNGSMYMHNNYNFSAVTYDGTDAYNSGGCVKYKGYKEWYTDEKCPYNPANTYVLEFDYKCDTTGVNQYVHCCSFDIDNNVIMVKNCDFVSGSTTTLAQDLKDGDTIVYLTSVAGFDKATSTAGRYKGFIVWDYVNSYGYQYPAETYSRHIYTSLWTNESQFDTTNNTITLNSAWNHGTITAGTALSQCNNANSFRYLTSWATATVDLTWRHFKLMVTPYYVFTGAASVSPYFITNYSSGTAYKNATSKYTNVQFYVLTQTPKKVTFNNGGSGAASGTTFDGSSAVTVSYNTIGAAAASAIKDATLTIKQNDVSKGTFTANASTNKTIELTDTTYENKAASSGGTDISLVTTGDKYNWNQKQDALTFDIIPTSNSNNPVTSGGIYNVTQDIREVAENKKQTYVASDVTNPILNSQNSTITIDSSIVDIEGTQLALSALNIGDTIYISELDVPDRWVSSFLDRIAVISASGQSSKSGTPAPDNPITITSSIYYDSNYNPVELRGINNIADTYSNGTITRYIGKYVFTGTESFDNGGGSTLTGYRCLRNTSLFGTTIPIASENVEFWCTHFLTWTSGSYNVANYFTRWMSGSTPSNQGMFCISEEELGITSSASQGEAVSAFKDWLTTQYNAGTPVIVYYPLKTTSTENVILYDVGERTGAVLSKLETAKVPISSISVNGTEVTPVNSNVNIAVPTTTSDLDNNSGFITNSTAQISENQVTNLTGDLLNIREVAEGKKQTYVASSATNPGLNSQADELTLNTPVIDIEGTSITFASLNIGDTFYITETNIPDRWVSSFLDRIAIDTAEGSSTLIGTPTPTSPANIVSTTYYDSNYNPIELRSVGNYKDTYANGVITRNVGIMILKGTESWTSTGETYGLALYASSYNVRTGAEVMCSHFAYTSSTMAKDTIANTSSAYNYRINADENIVDTTSGTTKAETFKAWLNNQYTNDTPVIVLFPLATPSTENVILYEVGERRGVVLNKLETAKVPIASISVNGTNIAPISNNVDIVVPTTTNELTNNSGFITNATAQITESQVTNLTNDLSNIREVAEGKTQTYVVSDSDNPLFNSQSNTITVSSSITSIDGKTIEVDDLKIGDTIYVTETDVPDRWVANYNGLPSGYIALEYIQSDGYSWLDTGYIGSSNTKIEMKINFVEDGNYKGYVFYFGEREGFEKGFALVYNNNNANRYFRLKYGTYENDVNYSQQNGVDYSISFGDNYLTINGTSFTTSSQTFQNIYTFKIFGTNGTSGDTFDNRNIIAKLYYLKIYENNVLVKHLIPCYKTSDNITGMYDMITDTFLTNLGSGTFSRGPEKLKTSVILSKLETVKVPVSDVQVNGTSIVSNNVANIDIDGILKSITGYDSTKTQSLKNVNGTLQWVTD